tara:strand:- start:70 stop:786 length:717 start_codon:yes stop_codon:yes gene_type:complete
MNKREDKYIINLSHEFKTPVSNLSLLLETLYDYDLNISIEQKREILELGLKEIKRLRDLITQFLYFKEELELDAHKKERTIFPFLNIESNLSYELLFFYKNSFVSFKSYSCTSPGYISVHKKLYLHTIVSLLGNASKFIPELGWVNVENDILTSICLLSFSYSRISISSITDNGIGFSSPVSLYMKPKPSCRFLSDRPIRLGLTIVKEILSFHSSILICISYPYRGSKLFFTLRIDSY